MTAAASSMRKPQLPVTSVLQGLSTQGHANLVRLVSHGTHQGTHQLNDVSTELSAVHHKGSRQRTAAASSSQKLQVPLSGFLSGRRTQGHANLVWLVSHCMQQGIVQLKGMSMELRAASLTEAANSELRLPPRGSRGFLLAEAAAASSWLP